MHNDALIQACQQIGGQLILARKLNISSAQLNKWLNGGIRIPYGYALAIEQLTGGEITCKQLMPKYEFLTRAMENDWQKPFSLLEARVKRLEMLINCLPCWQEQAIRNSHIIENITA